MEHEIKEVKYYFEAYDYENKYRTLWNGFLKYSGNTIPINNKHVLNNNKLCYNNELNDILIETCELNFYISLINDFIYLSHDTDEYYYYYQFEKNIKSAIKNIEVKFNIIITNGEFYATEVKHNGNQYKYTISKNSDKIILKKIILNWENFNNKKKAKKDEKDLLSDSIKNMNI